MRLAFICPRYLTDHPGGAEKHCQELAFRMAGKGHDVEIFATTAKDHFSWENHYPEKTFEDKGVTVRLFNVSPRPDVEEFYKLQREMADGEKLNKKEEEIWLSNSVNSDGLYKFIRENSTAYDRFIFIPYLFGLTINGTKVCPEKSYLIPCLHDESFARLNCIKETFKCVKKVLFNAPPELELAKELYDLSDDKCEIVSLGFESDYVPEPEKFKQKYNINLPYITFAGRREIGKNFQMLLEMVRLFQQIYPDKIAFVTMGAPKVDVFSSEKGKIFDVGFLSEEEKYDCFAGALANCQPSVNESLSITVMESWLAGVPVMVNRGCNVTSYWTKLSKGGLLFTDYFDFEQSLLYLLENREIAREMAENGKYFVEENFNWNSILERLENALL